MFCCVCTHCVHKVRQMDPVLWHFDAIHTIDWPPSFSVIWMQSASSIIVPVQGRLDPVCAIGYALFWVIWMQSASSIIVPVQGRLDPVCAIGYALFWVIWMHSSPSCPVTWNVVVILSACLCLGLLVDFFPSGFATAVLYALLTFLRPRHSALLVLPP